MLFTSPCTALLCPAETWARDVVRVPPSARGSSACTLLSHPLGTCAATHRWSSGSGLLPFSSCRYHVQCWVWATCMCQVWAEASTGCPVWAGTTCKCQMWGVSCGQMLDLDPRKLPCREGVCLFLSHSGFPLPPEVSELLVVHSLTSPMSPPQCMSAAWSQACWGWLGVQGGVKGGGQSLGQEA